MKKHSFLSTVSLFLSFPLFLAFCFTVTSFTGRPLAKVPVQEAPALEGRWDLTLEFNGRSFPSWLEVTHSGTHTLVGRFVGIGGSARPVAKIEFKDGRFSFSIPPQWEGGDHDFQISGELENDQLKGIIQSSDDKKFAFTGVRAPDLSRSAAPVWGKPIRLFNGSDLTGWHALGNNQWVADQGILRSPHSGANLVTDRKFEDFKLHIEFRYPEESNSGVYLRGRYEVQVMDSKGHAPAVGELGAIYGFLPPNEMAAKAPGEWQSYDITLVGRMVTVVLNGKTVICRQNIPGITGGALDSREGEPGPIYLQGDHGPIEYRNIILTPAR